MLPHHNGRASFPTLELLQDLLESNDLLEKMGEIGKIGAWKVEIATNKTFWTKQLYVIYELESSHPLTFEEIIQLELPQYRSAHKLAVRELMERGTPFDLEVETLTTKGNHRWLRIIGKGLYDPDGNITHRIGITQDITVRKTLEQKAIETLRKYQSLFEGICDAVLLIEDETGRISDANHSALNLYGYSKEEFIGKPFRDLCVDPDTSMNLIKEGNTYVPLQWHRKKSGMTFPVELTLNCLYLHECKTHIVVARDISARIESEQKIRALLQEKELLLKEVHHRVKNHMQTVTSLLQLHANASEDPYIIETLEEANNKLKSLAILYDKLYRTHQIQHLSLKEYLPTLVKEIIDSFPKKFLLTLEVEVEDLVLPVKQLSFVGIIVNELITNSLKYAFKGRTEGRLRVSAREHIPENGYAEGKLESFVSLIVEDDGNGIPESIDLDHVSSFGLQLIQALTHQLGGTLRISRQNGTKFELEFPIRS